MIFKIGPIPIPIKNEKWPLGLSYGSIILKIVLWASFTSSHVVLRELSDWTKNPILGQATSILVYCPTLLYDIVDGNQIAKEVPNKIALLQKHVHIRDT